MSDQNTLIKVNDTDRVAAFAPENHSKGSTQGLSRDLFFNIAAFEHAQRIAKMFAESRMVPDHFRNNIADCLIALNYAARVGADPFMTMQNIYVIHGRPGIQTNLALAIVKDTGKFTPLQYHPANIKTSCYCSATRKDDDVLCKGPKVSLDMAKKEGWLDKKGSKWKSMPELMLRYRAAMFWIRMYAPECLLGMQSVDELKDTIDLTRQPNGSYLSGRQTDLTKEVHAVAETAASAGRTEAPREEKPPQWHEGYGADIRKTGAFERLSKAVDVLGPEIYNEVVDPARPPGTEADIEAVIKKMSSLADKKLAALEDQISP